MAPSGFEHGFTTVKVTIPIGQFVQAHQLGIALGAETGFIIRTNPDTVRAPDVAFVAAARVPSGGLPSGFWPGAPDLVVEIVSPSDTLPAVRDKVQEWLDAGVRLVWVVNPKRRSVTEYAPKSQPRVLGVGDTLDGGAVLPGFMLAVADIFY